MWLFSLYAAYAVVQIGLSLIIDGHGEASMVLRFMFKLAFFVFLLRVLTEKNIALLLVLRRLYCEFFLNARESDSINLPIK